MTNEYPERKIDAIAIEREAQRLRAEAMANGVRNFRAWVARQFSGNGAVAGKPAH